MEHLGQVRDESLPVFVAPSRLSVPLESVSCCIHPRAIATKVQPMLDRRQQVLGPFAPQLVPIPQRLVAPDLPSSPGMAVPKVFGVPACVYAIARSEQRNIDDKMATSYMDLVDGVAELVVGDPLGEHSALRCLRSQKAV